MPGDAPEFAALVDRYRSLGTADRKAVRRALSASEFEALETACGEIDKARRAELAPERQYRGYSPWLAAVIERSLGDDRAQPEVTGECRAAIAATHRSLIDDAGEEGVVARLGRMLGWTASSGDAAGRA